jgi:MFS family permease
LTPELEPLRRNRNFALLWMGGAVSAVGSRASAIAFPLLVLAIGGSASDAGLVGAAAMVPNVIFQIPAGVLVDRWDRRLVMIVSDAGRALAIGSVAVAAAVGRASVPQLAAAAFVEGTLTVFHVLAQRAAVRTVVPDGQLGAALSRNEVATRAAFLAGQPLGGVLFAVGRWVPFLVDCASYLVSLTAVLLLRGEFRVTPAPLRRRVWPEVRQGFDWLWHQPFLRAVAGSIAVGNLLVQAAYLTVIVTITERGGSPAVIGLVLAGTGVGGIAGALAAPWIARKAGVASIFIAVNWAWAALILFIAIADDPVASGAGFALFAFAGATANVVVGAYQLRITPQHLLARVSSIIGMVSWGTIPVGSVLAGFLLDHYGGTAPLAALSGLMFAVAIAVTLSPGLRAASDLEISSEHTEPAREKTTVSRNRKSL